MIFYLILLISVIIASVKAEPTCFTGGELAGVIFGSIFGTVLICTACFVILAFCTYKHKKALKNQIFEKAHGTQETDETISTLQDFSEKGISTDAVDIRKRVSMRDKETEVALPTPLPRRKGPLTPKGSLGSSQRSQSLDALREDEDKKREKQEKALSKFGFSIGGDEYEGIYIDRVIPGTPAELSGNIFSGDKIKTLTIGFDEMSYDEALAILSLVTEHTIRLDLERIIKFDEETQTEGGAIKADMRLPLNLLKSFSMNAIKRKLEACPHRNFEHLEGPALPKRQQENVPLPSCKHCFEEERIIKVVRHLGGKIKTKLIVTSESEEDEEEISQKRNFPPGHGLIRAEEFDKKIKNSLQIESRALKISSIPSSSGASSGSAEENLTDSTSSVSEIVEKSKTTRIISSEATIEVRSEIQIQLESVEIPLPTRIEKSSRIPIPSKTTRIISTEATIEVRSETQIQLESVEIPLPTRIEKSSRIPIPVHKVPTPPRELTPPLPPPPPPIILMPPQSEDSFLASEPTSQPSPESAIESSPPSSPEPQQQLKIDIDESQQLSIISPKIPAASLTPDFIEVRAQKFSNLKDDETILDRKLPEIPSTALRKKDDGKADPGQMYLKVRNGLREVYTGTFDDKKSS
uniref:PDZ domain-containing protein n=1 Tax=Panagrolaimus sp. PS1159 TaxID=55785 RepID=A0AC35G308_9BILA